MVCTIVRLVTMTLLLLDFCTSADDAALGDLPRELDTDRADPPLQASPVVVMRATSGEKKDNSTWLTADYTYKLPRWPNGTRNAPLLPHCRLLPASHRDHLAVLEMLDQDIRLIEYHLNVVNYTEDPLVENSLWTYKLNMWSRIVSAHGQTILNLAFNYNVLSLMTLTFGVSKLTIDFRDEPYGCVRNLTEHEKVQTILDIIIRDLNGDGPPRVIEGKAGICHQVMKVSDGAVKFTDRCCYRKLDKDEIECYIDIPNRWLRLLDVMMALLVTITFVFGPLFVPDWLYAASLENADYVVKLKEPLYKNVCVCRRELFTDDIKAKHKMDLRNKKDFVLCRRLVSHLPSDMIVPIKISQFDIKVAYRKLLTEEHVPVGIVECISRALFLCKLKELEPFNDCCEASYLGCLQKEGGKQRMWIEPCNIIGRLVLVLVLPIPFYIRLAMYYLFEHPEIVTRYYAALRIGLPVHHNFRLMQYLTPTHPLFIATYIIYLTAGMIFAYCSTKSTKTHFQQAIIDAFAELTDMSFLNALAMVIRNMLLPFRKYGIFGIVCGCLFWPVFVPVSLLAFFLYCLPIVFLTCRIVMHMFKRHSPEKPRSREFHKSVNTWEAEKLLEHINVQTKHAKKNCYCSFNGRRIVVNLGVTLMSLLTIYSAMLMISEVAGYMIEILCFTLMGLIVNASKVLKYGSLIFLVIVYSYDTYNNVNKKYLKLNKALFSDIKYRIKDIEEHTSLPSYLQENRGFKACEASEQAEYELEDDISDEHKFHWDINDLILFIDSEDTPRIPKKLFDDTCQIQVAGNPGPVYRSLLAATGRFFAIILFLVFVFIVVMSFGEVYKISSTNQMLATLAGGFMPYIFRSLLRPEEPQVETNLVSFKSKLEEIIKNFCQPWPMYDFIFDVEEKPPPEEDSDEEENSSDKSWNKDNKDKNKNIKDKKKDKDVDRKISTTSGVIKPAGSMEILERSPSVLEEKEYTIKDKIESMDLEPAEGGDVDLLILISESDRDWVMEWSSIGDIAEVTEELNDGLSRVPTIKLGTVLGGDGMEMGKGSLMESRSRNNSTALFPPHMLL